MLCNLRNALPLQQPFPSTQRSITGGVFFGWPAIVAEEHRKCMFRSSTFTQFHEFLADTFIQTGRHRSKKPALDILNVREFFYMPVRTLYRAVNRMIGKKEEERLVQQWERRAFRSW